MPFISVFYNSINTLIIKAEQEYHVSNIDISWHNLKSLTYHT